MRSSPTHPEGSHLASDYESRVVCRHFMHLYALAPAGRLSSVLQFLHRIIS
jgi:hypothetical protein